MRDLVVSDIHGCLEEFDELLRVVEYKPATDRLVLLGDLIDRGPDSIGVVRRARELKAEAVLGNHEEKQLLFRRRQRQNRETGRVNHMQFGPAKRAVFDQFNEEDWAYLEAMPLWIDLGDGLTAVHAGFEPGLSMQAQRSDKVVRVVYVGEDGKMAVPKQGEDPHAKPAGSHRWALLWDRFDVVYGHAVFSLGHPIDDFVGPYKHRAIDTGCYAGGRLTALVREQSTQYVQVQAKHVYEAREVAEL